MCPGVPVTAWATMRPRRSKTPAERSPDSRTMDVNDERMSAAACSLTVATSRLQRMSRVIWSMGAPRPPGLADRRHLHDHVRGVVDPNPRGRVDHDRGLSLLDDRRPLEHGAGAQRVAVVYRNLR